MCLNCIHLAGLLIKKKKPLKIREMLVFALSQQTPNVRRGLFVHQSIELSRQILKKEPPLYVNKQDWRLRNYIILSTQFSKTKRKLLILASTIKQKQKK